MSAIDLFSLGGGVLGDWPFGDVIALTMVSPSAVASAVATHLEEHRPAALAFWDRRLGPPPTDIDRLLDQPDDVWHAGLALGTAGQPSVIDLVAPTWMLNADPPADRAATSWRLSLRACVARTEVITGIGFLDPAFASTTAADLELGHRWIGHGARCRHEPGLLAAATPVDLPPIGARDQVRFVERRFGRSWAFYAALRSGRARSGWHDLREVVAETRPRVGTLHRAAPAPAPATAGERVSVVIPTVDRYQWLGTVLRQLAEQSVPPGEVLVVDQTDARDRRDPASLAPAGLPLRVLTSEVAGQCTARNLALAEATGDLVLFLDDDDELPPDLLGRHLARLEQTGADANCGIAVEPGEDDLDPAFRRLRPADVFPTNNTLLRREALEDAGLFDLAYDRGERADHDLGMRLYLSGRRLVLDPDAEVLHHHAPRGGLRAHAARVSTYRAARHSLLARQDLAPTEVYLWRRYFRPDQVEEAVRLRLLGTLSRRGSVLQRAGRALVQLVLLPDTRRRLHVADTRARDLARHHPTIPELPPRPTPDR